MIANNFKYDLENPGNIKERLLLYSDLVKRNEAKKKADEEKKTREGKEE